MYSPTPSSLKVDSTNQNLNNHYRPFARNDDYGTCGWHGPKFTLCEWMRVFVRGLALATILSTLLMMLTISIWLIRDENRLARFWSLWLPWFDYIIVHYVAGFSIRVVNENEEEQNKHVLPIDPQASVLVCNHVSYWDIPILYEVFQPSFVAAASVQDIPLFGRMASILGAIFVAHPNGTNKQCKSSTGTFLISQLKWLTKKRNERNDDNHNATKPILIFPEGTTSNGSYLLPFRTGAFAAGVPVQPIHLEFPFTRFNPSWESIGVRTHLLRFLAQPSHRATVTILKPLVPTDDDIVEFANQARAAIARAGNLQITDMGYRDKHNYHQALGKQGYS